MHKYGHRYGILFFLVFFLALSVGACSSSNDDSAAEPVVPETTDPDADPGADPETDPPGSDPNPDTNPETDPPGTDPDPDPDSIPGSDPDTDPPPGSDPDSDPDSIPGSDPDTDPDSIPGSDPDTDPPPGSDPAFDPMAQSARYSLSFNATWSEETHPLLFPDNPHFSGLTGAVHNDQVIFWERGQIATDGIEQMAETGGSAGLLSEVAAAIADGKASVEIDEGGIGESPGNIEIEFTVTRDYPLITVTSMLAPSPDWFIGVNALSMLSADGELLEEMSIDLTLYDAGTDSGPQYTSSNEDTQPRETITFLTSGPLDTPFVDGEPVVGQFVIQRIE